ncbi:hypothetical protein PHMEG_00030326 [Phytophthora megakarya]|uniref:Uncharacterized protein n=1 Tax=Phytophthora megakarya TaxID=4795 RepID=A0A225V0I3_9STRA|nr:hypothetical protein PHMEG_00030326 [Phytophthora megakarya]
MRLQLTGIRSRSPLSSFKGEPARKRPFLTQPTPSKSIPSYHESSSISDAARTARSETRQGASAMQVDSEPAVVGADSGTNVSGFSSSEASWLSITDYMASSGAHMSMPGKW